MLNFKHSIEARFFSITFSEKPPAEVRDMLKANGLRWSGRPIFQSYSVYEPILDARNVAHLSGPDAPDDVFLTFFPIDGRLAALDDSGSLLSRIEDKSAKRRMPPGKRTPWTEAETQVLRAFVVDLDKKQKK